MKKLKAACLVPILILLFQSNPIFFHILDCLLFIWHSISKYTLCNKVMYLFSQKTSEEITKLSEKPPMNPSATLPANIDDETFGSRKARSSFGKGFFKIRGGKKAAGSPNLGKSKPQGLARGFGGILYCSGVSQENITML